MKPPFWLLFTLLVMTVIGTANAQVISYAAQGSFGDGGTFTCTFDYAVVSNVYSNINCSSTMGSVRSGATYHYVCGSPDIPTCGGGFSPHPTSVAFQTTSGADQTGLPTLFMSFSQPLGAVLSSSWFYWYNAVGFSFPLLTGDHLSDEGTCGNASCTVDPNTRFTTSGTATVTGIQL